ncbi:TRAP transporter small permease [Bacillus haikouensis]|jgi:TRAP-type transport system small permease protein|uniref:TRAP transporter small permease n=1 Tax=Bacillus haikouensis TaxID=1510468 RepID=UPI0015539D34|nr:TRAP transporter small permease [Bacillus haikouensis]NQD66436.1 TRAP transporter small permease [Bacillus haikouensis]
MKKKRDFAMPFRYLIGFSLFIIVVVTILQVIARFVFDQPLVWSDELARFILIWMVFIGAAVVSFDDKHMAVEVFQEKMSPKVKLITSLLMRVLILLFIAITAYSSIELVKVSHYLESGALEIPFSYWRVSATVGLALMFIFILIRSIYDIQDYKKGIYRNSSIVEEVKK